MIPEAKLRRGLDGMGARRQRRSHNDPAATEMSNGVIESFLSGVYAGLVFVPIYNFLTRRWGVPAQQ